MTKKNKVKASKKKQNVTNANVSVQKNVQQSGIDILIYF